jgi:hypothetical protein
VDLSSPEGHSVNDGIDPNLCSFKYISVRDVSPWVRGGAFMAKLDLKSAYRMVPVHSADRHLLGVRWGSASYCDAALPFGLRSAPIIFNSIADALAWAMKCRGIENVVHYLDDFLFWSNEAPRCQADLNLALSICNDLGLPAEPSKVEGPAQALTFLGIEINSVMEELRLPHPKLLALKQLLFAWASKKAATKRELQMMLGHLNHAATVVPVGKPFVRNLITAMAPLKQPAHYTRLNSDCRSDLAWWIAFVDSWNGINLFPCLSPGPTITADASGGWGCGAFCYLGWFQVRWPNSWERVNT